MKPRLAETESELWKAIEQQRSKFNTFGSIVIDTLGEGTFSFDVCGKIIKTDAIKDKSMYWGELPVYSNPTSKELASLDWALSHDTAEIWFEPWSRHNDSKLLHSPSGLSWERINHAKSRNT